MSALTSSRCVWTALPEQRVWLSRPAAEDLRRLPDRPAVFVLADENANPIQLSTTQSLRRTLLARIVDAPTNKRRADVAAITRQVHWRPLHTAFEARWWYYQLARELHPREYRRLVSFGPASFLHVDWEAAVPELRVSDAVWMAPGEFLGPWPTLRACQAALEGLVDLFDLCRYPERVRQAPRGVRCAYADMGRCDAPCDGSVPLPEYVARCRKAWAFACGDTAGWIAGAEERMRRAAQERRFEQAAAIKEQLAFARKWEVTNASGISLASDMNEAVLLPATRRRAWKGLLFQGGLIVDGPVVTTRALPGAAIEWLASRPISITPAAPAIRMEQTWLWCSMRTARCPADPVLRLHLEKQSVLDWEQAIRAHLERHGTPSPGSRGHTPAADQGRPALS